ncbi:MipA/OmpV family protein [Variovorax sp. AFSI2.2]|uniref:MipA/OmpV family protein n=1 Tax=Variovorax sp. AFSI2.2 TaxID=3384160 RepID=UPI003EB9BE66
MKKHMLRRAPNLLGPLVIALVPLAARAEETQTWSDRLLGDKTQVSVGAATIVAPRYLGSDSYRVQLLPVFAIERGIFFADTSRGAGVQFQTDSGFYASQSVYYDFGRLQRNSVLRPGSTRLAGMGDVPGSVTTRTLLMQQITPSFSVNAEAEFSLKDGARRNHYRLGAEYNLLKNSTDTVALDVDVHAGDRRYNQAYFGVTDAQSARTPFSAFKAGSGMYAYSIGASWSHTLSPHWTTTLHVAVMQYVDNAKASPLVAKRTSVTGDAAVTYTF